MPEEAIESRVAMYLKFSITKFEVLWRVEGPMTFPFLLPMSLCTSTLKFYQFAEEPIARCVQQIRITIKILFKNLTCILQVPIGCKESSVVKIL